MRRAGEESRGVASVELPAELRPTEGQIAVRAYDLYLQRGAADGRDLDDWLAAERELTHERRKELVGL